MLSADKDISAVPVAKKKVCWDRIAAVKQGVPPEYLENFIADADFNTEKPLSVYEPAKVRHVGTAVMLILLIEGFPVAGVQMCFLAGLDRDCSIPV
jgi:hypothetical protein